MSFDDLFDPYEEIHLLKIEIEELKQEIQDYKGLGNVLQKQRQELSYLLKESSFYMHEFENAIPEKDFKQCSIAASKKFEEWIKKEFELSTPEVTATIQP